MKKVLRIVFLYALVSLLWIFGTGLLIHKTYNPGEQLIAEIVKGSLFVIITGILMFLLINREISKLNRINQSLKESQNRYWNLFMEHPSALYYVEKNTGIIHDCNENASRYFGYKRNEVIGHNVSDFLILSYKDILNEILKQEDQNLFHLQTFAVLSSGEHRQIEVFGNLQKVEDRQFYLVAVYDVTETYKNENLYRFVFEKSPTGKALFNTKGEILRANDAFARFLDICVSEIEGKNLFENFNLFCSDTQNKLTPETTAEILFKPNNRDPEKWGKLITSDVIHETGNNYIIGMLENITAEKAYEKTLLEYQTIVEQSSVAIVTFNCEGTILYINNKFTELTGYKADEIIGQNILILRVDSQIDKVKDSIKECLLEGKTWNGELKSVQKNGQIYWERINIVPIKDEKGKIIKFLERREDITAQKEAYIELLLSKEFAEKASRAKTDFLSNLSHELRTPMNGIIGFTELLLEEEKDKHKSGILEIMKKSENTLLKLINRLLDMSNIEAGHTILEETEFTMSQLYKTIYTNFYFIAVKKGLSFSFISNENLNVPLRGDRSKIEYILGNLTGNAIKFTHSGSITLSMSLLEDDNQYFLQAEVADTGIGISQKIHDKIFEKFEQGEHYLSKKYEGAGLGLTIVKHLTEFLGGEIYFVSEEDKGSTFTVKIPVKLA
jgi:PAS domain S-box-containing protein